MRSERVTRHPSKADPGASPEFMPAYLFTSFRRYAGGWEPFRFASRAAWSIVLAAPVRQNIGGLRLTQPVRQLAETDSQACNSRLWLWCVELLCMFRSTQIEK